MPMCRNLPYWWVRLSAFRPDGRIAAPRANCLVRALTRVDAAITPLVTEAMERIEAAATDQEGVPCIAQITVVPAFAENGQ